MPSKLRGWLFLVALALLAGAPETAFSDDPKVLIPPKIESVPPPSSLLYLTLPYSGPDPLRIIMVEGPPRASEKDAKLLRERVVEEEKSGKTNPCTKLILAGIEATRDKNFEAAEEFLYRVRSAQCDDGFAAYYLGTLFEYRGQYWQAVQILPLAYTLLQKNYPEHRYIDYADAMLGRTYYRLGQPQEALLHLERVLAKYGGDLPHTYYAGMSYLKLGMFERGTATLERVSMLARYTPNSRHLAILTYETLAEVYLKTGKWSAAEKNAALGLSMDPKNGRLLTLMAQIQEAKKNAQHRAGPAAGNLGF